MALPIVGGVCDICRDILKEAETVHKKLKDVQQIVERVWDVAKYLEKIDEVLEHLDESKKGEIEMEMQKIKENLHSVRDSIKKFQKAGFLEAMFCASR